jgi:hypothetical protein
MGTALLKYKKEILQEIHGLPPGKLKEVLDFVCFIKAKDAIDPSQAYFWTKKWQEMEQAAEKDKKTGRMIGNGSVQDLLHELNT